MMKVDSAEVFLQKKTVSKINNNFGWIAQ